MIQIGMVKGFVYPSVPKCQGDIDVVCYTGDGDLKNLENQPY
jgi:hypothetical protein